MALGIFEVREIVERVFAQQDVLDACARRDLGRVIMILGAQGLTQGRISELTGISQGRLSGRQGASANPGRHPSSKRSLTASGCRRRHGRRWGSLPMAPPVPARASLIPPGTGLPRRHRRSRRPRGRAHLPRREVLRRASPACWTGRQCRAR